MELSRSELFELFDDLIVKSWNSDPRLTTEIVKGDDTYKAYRYNLLETMIDTKVLAEWVEYFQNKTTN